MGVNGCSRKEGRERCSGGEFELADLLAKQCSLLGKKSTKEAALGNCSALKNLRRQIDSKVLVWEAGPLKLSLVSWGDVRGTQ